jgi:hypothetical protein
MADLTHGSLSSGFLGIRAVCATFYSILVAGHAPKAINPGKFFSPKVSLYRSLTAGV